MADEVKKIKVKATMKINLGQLEGMPPGQLAYFNPGDEMEVPDCPEIRFYIEHGGLQLVEEYPKSVEDKPTETTADKPAEESTTTDKPKKKKGGGK